MLFVNIDKTTFDKELLKKWLEEAEKITYRLKAAASVDEINKIIEEYEKHLKKDIFLIKEWLEEAEKITYRLKAAASVDERKKIIEEHEKHLKKDIFLLKEWLEEAETITCQLKNAISEDERKKIIEKNEEHWRKDIFRNWLIDQFHGKCWYSEAKESVSSYHVDHFRPKGRAKEMDGSSRDGYWWLAFKWDNYRISGGLLNVKKKDMFPLTHGHPAQPFDEPSLEIEAHILLDPCKKGEAFLISFEAGLAVPAESDDEDKYRADKTIEILGLNRLRRLVDNRSDKWTKCHLKILEYENASGHQALKMFQRASATKALKEMVKPEEEFSSVALACINKIAPVPLRQEIMT